MASHYVGAVRTGNEVLRGVDLGDPGTGVVGRETWTLVVHSDGYWSDGSDASVYKAQGGSFMTWVDYQHRIAAAALAVGFALGWVSG